MSQISTAEVLQVYYDMLNTTGIWPQKNPSWIYRLKMIVSWIFAWALFIIMTIETIHDLNDFTKLSEIIYINATCVTYITKLIIFTLKRNKFLQLVKFLKSPIFGTYPSELNHYMEDSIKFSNMLAKIYQYAVGCCVSLYAIYPIIDKTSLPIPFPYDLGKYTYYVFIFEVAGVGVGAWNNSSIDVLSCSLIGIASAHFEILAEKIKRCTKNANEDYIDPQIQMEILRRVNQCVDHHLAILKLIDRIEDMFTIGLLAQYVATAICVCNTLFHIVLVATLNSQLFMLLNYLLIIVAQLFLYCWYGNTMILKSIEVRDACYNSKWYNCGTEVRRSLFLIMERSKKPSAVTTLKLSTLSFNAFSSILRWSYSCLTLLLKMYEKREHN